MSDATAHYERREAEIGAEGMRTIERQVMLRLIDQRWREHLAEMDYLREGIHLRAMGQKDPLNEWQREGFDMFGVMIDAVARDFVVYLMHANVSTEEASAGSEPAVSNVRYTAPVDPSEAGSGVAAAAGSGVATAVAPAGATGPQGPQTPVVKSDWDGTPRNAPCPCGSGKKFKFCHGADR